MDKSNLQQQAYALRFLCARMAEKSGHAGMPLGMADVATVLWNCFMNLSNKNPGWSERDRFILSCGHGSALLYSLLYCMKVATLEDLHQFRKFGSRTPGHPEIGCLPGVEMTTGPLGQGLAWGIGMAKAAMDLDKEHYTYIVCSDGDLMEGIAHEALALARLWNLRRCIVLWDDNKVTIDGRTDISCGAPLENIFHAHGWKVIHCDGHDYDAIYNAIENARNVENGPVCIRCETIIGYGLDTAGTSKAHGPGKLDQLKRNLEITYDEVPESILGMWQAAIDRGNACASESEKHVKTKAPSDFKKIYDTLRKDIPQKISTRKLAGKVIEELDGSWVVGSADLGGSTCTQGANNYLNFGVREHAMVATMGGISIYGAGQHVLCSTFLTFFDYARPAIRLAAIMKTPMILLATHDSIAVGCDGPTHQPIEQLNSYRIMPNTHVWRPSNLEDMIAAFEDGLTHNGPTIIACTRQDIEIHSTDLDAARRGGYLVTNSGKSRIIATGSEVSVAMRFGDVISMPCLEVFEVQDQDYKDTVLNGVEMAIEAGDPSFWYKYCAKVIGVKEFGTSAPGDEVYEKMIFGDGKC